MTALTNTETFGSASLVSKYEYVLNEKAQRSERTQSGSQPLNSTDSFTYDDLGQVTAFNNSVNTTQTAWNPLYNFDDIGNRTNDIIDLNGTKTYTSNLLNQIDSLEAQALLYDLDGNLTNVDAWTYTWNAENRLIRATDGVTTLDFAYDYQGRLVQKTKAGVETIYVYDGWNRVAKLVNGSQSETYLWGLDFSGSMQGAGGVGGLLKEGTLYPLFDANGNILQKLSATSSVVMNVSYDPFGNIIDGTLSGEYGFSTKPMVEDLNWYYYGFRYYDPETGRWPNRDPMGEQGGYNLYAFVGNNGVNSFDYLGTELGAFPSNNEVRIRTHSDFDVMFGEDGEPDIEDLRATKGRTIIRYPSTYTNESEGTTLSLSGAPRVSISFHERIDPRTSTDSLGTTTWDHEFDHVEIARRWWDQGKAIVDAMEGDYCTEECRGIAQRIVGFTMAVHEASQDIENAEYDIRVYGNRSQRPHGARRTAENNKTYYERALEREGTKFENKGCSLVE